MVCSQCSNRSGALKCSRCKMMTYCNRKCQAAHWPVHKIQCKQFKVHLKNLSFILPSTRAPDLSFFWRTFPFYSATPDAPRELTSR
ncbi:hypothetical protein B0H14DRAFT_2913166 [Mycena olivaceomarginata]|nr:hypothetical protein B0H14DRAFT_2913166 [Mycena olivaceomarginata]